ncbi:uncharacterized protein LOC102069189 [Anopheles sinensis]|uniref:Uncharacterized protein LOC102069189 n=1 Tax=Anopheles sinensis TaxID=74873 RepID=A0A084WH74_ANOSI|nr:uncharacterized protein LOC102069189 [Anopheles sinensis]
MCANMFVYISFTITPEVPFLEEFALVERGLLHHRSLGHLQQPADLEIYKCGSISGALIRVVLWQCGWLSKLQEEDAWWIVK